MKRISLFIIGFLFIYFLAVVLLNLFANSPQQKENSTPAINIQPQPTHEATDSAQKQDAVMPNF